MVYFNLPVTRISASAALPVGPAAVMRRPWESAIRAPRIPWRGGLASDDDEPRRALRTGLERSLPLTPDTEHALNEAAADIVFIRNLLLQALNMDPQ